MKRLFYVVTAFAALSLAACGKEVTPSAPSAPIIEMEGLNIEEVHEITDGPMRVKVGVRAEGGIETFSVKIESPLLTDELLREIDLAAEMELTAPASDEMAAALKNLGFPVGGNVKGSTDQSFDISQFMPLIKQLYREGFAPRFRAHRKGCARPERDQEPEVPHFGRAREHLL